MEKLKEPTEKKKGGRKKGGQFTRRNDKKHTLLQVFKNGAFAYGEFQLGGEKKNLQKDRPHDLGGTRSSHLELMHTIVSHSHRQVWLQSSASLGWKRYRGDGHRKGVKKGKGWGGGVWGGGGGGGVGGGGGGGGGWWGGGGGGWGGGGGGGGCIRRTGRMCPDV